MESICAQLGDGRHLPQQAQRVEAALLERARRPRQLGGPAELAFDFLDELADLGGGGLRLLVLDPDQRGLVLAIIEENLENAVGQQRDADDGDEQRDIFGEQPAADFLRPGAPGGTGCRAAGRRRQRPALGRVGMQGNAHPGQASKNAWTCLLPQCGQRRRRTLIAHPKESGNGQRRCRFNDRSVRLRSA